MKGILKIQMFEEKKRVIQILAKFWSWKYIEKGNMFDIVKVIVKSKSDKLKWKVYWKCKYLKKKVDPNIGKMLIMKYIENW